jgi:hypothetical protein
MTTHNHGKPVFEQDLSYLSNIDPYVAVFDWGFHGLDVATGLMDSESRSYRVNVGTVVTNYDELSEKIIGYGGANYKPYQGVDKECAELTAQSEAIKRRDRTADRGTLVPILFDVVSSASPSQIESVIGIELPTLPPCTTCRTNLLPNHAVVITQSVQKYKSRRTPETTIVEVHTGLETALIGDPHRFPVKSRAKDIARLYPPRILEYPTEVNFYYAKQEYLETVKILKPDQRDRSLRAFLAVAALSNNLSIDR